MGGLTTDNSQFINTASQLTKPEIKSLGLAGAVASSIKDNGFSSKNIQILSDNSMRSADLKDTSNPYINQNSDLSDLNKSPFTARLPNNINLGTFIGENETPANAIMLNTNTNYRGPADKGLTPAFIAQAAIKANKDIKIVVPAEQPYQKVGDANYEKQRASIAEKLGVPAANLIVTNAQLVDFPTDFARPGYEGLVGPVPKTMLEIRGNLSQLNAGKSSRRQPSAKLAQSWD